MAEWRKIERDLCDTLGEGTLWSARDNAVYWVDILAPALNRLSLADGGIERWDMPEPLGWVAENEDGDLIGGFQSGFARISPDRFAVRYIADPEPHWPGNRMNDGKADRHGAVWCGTMDMAEEEERGSLYRLDPDGTCRVMDSGYMVPNGPAFSACGRWLYHSDTAKRTIYRFEITDSGIEAKEPFIRFGESDGHPDGMTVDSEGFLWVAHWGGGCISRFAPDGRRDRSISLPAQRITNVTFAGEGLDRMFVTSAATGGEASAFDGALFEVESGVSGLPAGIYRG
ncbi:SMP-30/gluconolactonase/LRE family protein [Novosphingobium beihaiensis]|uniref:SMP-30/gluconolactonase/LRE family protein n=1 Tax=Novosphingobium beihaiensis TaxID=2930389 RepID=A0ABT0BQ74_9SPHN|nr:SMP-30/gluconolactonase/LRE family protein [Novosphingobium beihaiensis]MCJ2187198.1 SMP-30/gluconolactonase/LRE family protein [Novosphingobium beihaiensis]